MERPLGAKKAKANGKVNNQRQRKIRQHEESQASATCSITASLTALDSSQAERWSRMEENETRREKLIEEQSSEQHSARMAREIVQLTRDLAKIGEEMIVVFRKFEELDPAKLETESSWKEYAIRREQLEYYTDSHNGVKAAIATIKRHEGQQQYVGESSVSPSGGKKRGRCETPYISSF
ncbi:uncharacterized protein LOC127242481 [Andrographis paniculata]|uniref:uncharacterized protein LOC127242481 n=1 Tax=Andrographis paniculata TaxID=175694 RepID=UPI0021E6F63B|nr:uncharacterized protein LOC127242481 [Andrographis paniculata]